jgi:hypothetical protein
MKQHLGDRRRHDNEEAHVAAREWLLMPEVDSYTVGNILAREEMGKIHQCAGGGGDYAEN